MAEIKKTLQDFINELGDPNEAYNAYIVYLAKLPKPSQFNKK